MDRSVSRIAEVVHNVGEIVVRRVLGTGARSSLERGEGACLEIL